MAKRNQITEQPAQFTPKKLEDARILVRLFNAFCEIYKNNMKMRRDPSKPFERTVVKPPAFIHNDQILVNVPGQNVHPIDEPHVNYDWHGDNLPKLPGEK